MRRNVGWALLLALGACGENGQFVGDDLGDNYATKAGMEATSAMPSDALVATVVDFTASCEPEGAATYLTVEGVADGVSIVHEGVDRTACADWQVSALLDPDTHRLSTSYVNTTGRPCARRCAWTFAYTVEGLEAGEWDVFAAGDYATVEVP